MSDTVANVSQRNAPGWLALLTTRWHFSSRVIVGLVFVLVLAANLPGQWASRVNEQAGGMGQYGIAPQYEHGWPLTYLIREENWRSYYGSREYESPTVGKCLHFWQLRPGDELHLARCGANGLIAVAISLTFGFLAEFWNRRHRFWWQFHVADLVVGVAVLAACLGLYASARGRFDKERPVIAKLERHLAVGSVTFDSPGCELESQAPTWCQLSVGCDPIWFSLMTIDDEPLKIFLRVVKADAEENNLEAMAPFRELRHLTLSVSSGEKIELLRQFPNLESLTVGMTPDEDSRSGKIAGGQIPVLHLPKLPSLRLVSLRELNMRPMGLSGMYRLESLDMSYCPISDETMVELAHLTRLRELSLSDGKFTPRALEHLRSLKDLTRLSLDGTSTNDDSLHCLAALQSLTELSLQGTRVTSAGMHHLACLQNLRELDLRETEVDDDAIHHLLAIPALESLSLHDTKFTDKGVRQLLTMPKVWIIGTTLPLDAVSQFEKLPHLGVSVHDREVTIINHDVELSREQKRPIVQF